MNSEGREVKPGRFAFDQVRGSVLVVLTALMAFTEFVAAESTNDCFEGAVSQRQMNQCATQELERSRAELESILEVTRSGLQEESLRSFNASQQAWGNWLELQCDWERGRAGGGSIAPLIYSECLAQHTRMRSARLNQLRCGMQADGVACAQQ